MVYTYFKDIPKDILEAARLDGATLWQEMVRVLLPIAKGGLASTVLLSLILCWNEAFWSLNLTSSKAAPLTALIASYSSPEGFVLGQVVGGVDSGVCADPDLRLDQPETTGARPVVRRREMNLTNSTQSPVGIRQLAIVECHSAALSADTAPSRAGEGLQKSLQGSYE